MGFQNSNLSDFFRFYKKNKENDLSNCKKVELIVEVSFETFGQVQYKDEAGRSWIKEFDGTKWEQELSISDERGVSFSVFLHNQKLVQEQTVTLKLYVVKESGQFSCRGFRCLNVGFFLLKIVVFVFLGTVV